MIRIALAALALLVSVPALAEDSRLVVSTDGPKLRVTIDGKAHGKFTSKSLTIEKVAPGKHDVTITTLDAQLRKKDVYKGKLSVESGVEMRLRAAPEGLQITDTIALAKPQVQPQPVGEPIKDFSNGPSILHITSDKFMAMVLVDGTPLQQSDCTSPKACDVVDIAVGNHELDIRGGALGNKTIFKGIVKITGGAEVWGKAADNTFKIYNTQARAVQPGAATTVIVQQPATTTQTTTTTVSSGPGPNAGGAAIGMTFVDPATGEVVSMNVSAGVTGATSSVSVQETTTTTVSSAPAGAVVVQQQGGPGSIEFASEDGEGFTVFIDGKQVAQFVGGVEGQSVRVKNVSAGEHKLVVKDFMGNDVWATGRLYMDPGFVLKMGVSEGKLEAFNRENAWEPRR